MTTAATNATRIASLLKQAQPVATPSGLDQRTVPRLSVAELNAMDIDSIREMYHKSRRDDRGPVVKFLDLIDAPRNQLAAMVFPRLERRARERGERGAFGTGRVFASDVLRELGVENRVARGVLGFGLDLATDPLTYLGPAGWGAKVVSTTGKTVPITLRGTRALKRAEKAIKAGRAIEPGPVADIVSAAGQDFVPGQLRQQILGGRTPVSGAIRRGLRGTGDVLGMDRKTTGGLLAQGLGDVTKTGESARRDALIRASSGFVKKYGKGTSPGVRVGRTAEGRLAIEAGAAPRRVVNATSTIAHIPFTDVGIHIPAFTSDGRMALGALALASADRAGIKLGDTGRVRRIEPLVKRMEEIASDADDLQQRERAYREANRADVDTLEKTEGERLYEPSQTPSLLTDPYEPVRAELRGFRSGREAMDAEGRNLLDRIKAIRGEIETGGAPSVGEILLLNRLTREAEAANRLRGETLGGLNEKLSLNRLFNAEARDREKNVFEQINELSEFDEIEKAGDVRRRGFRSFLGIDAQGQTVINADPAVQRGVSEVARPLIDEYGDALALVTAAQKAGNVDAAAVTRLSEARENLLAATAPLREGPAMQTIDEASEAVRQRDLAQLSDVNRTIAEMGDDEIAGLELLRLHNQRAFEASEEMMEATQGSLLSYLNDSQHAALDSAKELVGSNDALIGSAGMMPMRTLAEQMSRVDGGVTLEMADRAARFKRRVLGNKEGGDIQRAARYVWSMGESGARRARSEALAQKSRELSVIAEEYGVDPQRLAVVATAVAHKMREAQAGKPLYHGTSFGTKEPAGWLVELQRAVTDGILNDATKPGLRAKLDEWVGQNLDILDDLGGYGERAGLFRTKPGYVPRGTSAAAEEFIRRQTALTGSGTAARRGLEQFQKPTSMRQARFRSLRAGKDVQVFEADRWAQTLTDAEIEAFSEPARSRIREMRDVLDEYDSMPDRPAMLDTDPFEQNAYVNEGRFNVMLGRDDVPGGFFETDMAASMGQYLGSYRRALANKFWKDYLPSVSLRVPAAVLQQIQGNPGAPIDLGNGAVGKLVRLGGGQNGIKVGDDIYRPLAAKYRNSADNPTMQMLGDAKTELFHDQVAEYVERMASLRQSDETTTQLARMFDRLTSLWKSLTLFHPSWFVFNMIGDGVLFWMADPKYPISVARNAAPVMKAMRVANDPEALRKITINVGGEEMNAADLFETLAASGVTKSGMFSSEVPAQLLGRGMMVMPSRFGGAAESFRPAMLRADFERASEQAATAFSNSNKLGTSGRAAGAVLNDRAGRTLGAWFRINEKMQDTMRTLAYLSYREQGWDHAQSVARTLRAGFDYQDLTRVERDYFRRMIPFYAFVRHNMGFQFKALLERPIFAGSFPLLQNAIEESIDGEDRMPTAMRPNWMREQLALQVGTDPKERFALLLGTALPQEQANVLGRLLGGGEGLQSFANYFLSSLNPILRAPIDIGAGREIFSGRTIGGDLSDISLTRYGLGQIRPLREIPKLAETFREQGVAAGIARALVGGRVQPMSDERVRLSRLREFKEEEEIIRRRIRSDERRGADSLRARARLLQLYRAMQQAGLGDEVPKWAGEQLGTIGAGEGVAT